MDAVTAGYKQVHPGATVTVFRAATGKLNARIAADLGSGGLKADVIWGTDPLSMQSYTDQQLLAPWPLPELTSVPTQYRTPEFWGTRLLYLVLVTRRGLQPAPTTWTDLTSPANAGKVAVPDPAFAGSAFAALGYFSQTQGMDFYRALRANGAIQVASIPDVVTQVAQGTYSVGITLDSGVRDAPPRARRSTWCGRSRERSPSTVQSRRPPRQRTPPPRRTSLRTCSAWRAATDRRDGLAADRPRSCRAGPASGRPGRGAGLERPVRAPAGPAGPVPVGVRAVSPPKPPTARLRPVVLTRAAVVVLVVLVVAGLVAVPMLFLLRGALAGGGESVAGALGNREVRVALWHTFSLAIVVTVAAVAGGTALAMAFDRSMVRRPAGWRIALVLPLLVPQFALTLSWAQAYGPGGLSDQLLGLSSRPLRPHGCRPSAHR